MARRRLAAALLALALCGCAALPPARNAYVGVFTGQFVDGLPLYRFPPVEVVGSRREGAT